MEVPEVARTLPVAAAIILLRRSMMARFILHIRMN